MIWITIFKMLTLEVRRISANDSRSEYFRGQKLSRTKKREIYEINFRVSRFLKEISRKKLSRIEEKVYFRIFFQFYHFSCFGLK